MDFGYTFNSCDAREGIFWSMDIAGGFSKFWFVPLGEPKNLGENLFWTDSGAFLAPSSNLIQDTVTGNGGSTLIYVVLPGSKFGRTLTGDKLESPRILYSNYDLGLFNWSQFRNANFLSRRIEIEQIRYEYEKI